MAEEDGQIENSGTAIEPEQVEDGDYQMIDLIIHPKGDEKYIAILPDPNDDYEVLFVRLDIVTPVPKKFKVRDGKIIPIISKEDKQT